MYLETVLTKFEKRILYLYNDYSEEGDSLYRGNKQYSKKNRRTLH